jgi:ribosome-associated protein
MLEINNSTQINEAHLTFQYSRSSGPGGQNVNKLNTRVILFFDVSNCSELSDSQKRQILKKLHNRIDKNGVLRIASQKYRTQNANRRAAVEKLTKLLASALKTKPPRRKTSAPKWANRKRLEQKRKKSQIKKLRSKPPEDSF